MLTPREIAVILLSTGLDVTIIGGEPTDQAEGVAMLCAILRWQRPTINIIIYSGYRYEELTDRNDPYLTTMLSIADTLVDGRYDAALNDDFVQWRGSRNQRAIDLKQTIRQERVVEIDWDSRQTITILPSGDILATKGMIALLAEDGDVVDRNRQCGSAEQMRSVKRA